MFCVRKTGHASFLVLVLNFIYSYPRNSLSTRKQFHKISPSLVSKHTLALSLQLRLRQNRELARSQGNPQPDQEATYSPGGGFSFNDVPRIDSFFMVPFVSSLKSHPWPQRMGFLLYFPEACGCVPHGQVCGLPQVQVREACEARVTVSSLHVGAQLSQRPLWKT